MPKNEQEARKSKYSHLADELSYKSTPEYAIPSISQDGFFGNTSISNWILIFAVSRRTKMKDPIQPYLSHPDGVSCLISPSLPHHVRGAK